MRPPFQTRKWNWNEHKFGHRSRTGPQPRTTVLAEASSNFQLCCAISSSQSVLFLVLLRLVIKGHCQLTAAVKMPVPESLFVLRRLAAGHSQYLHTS